MKEEGATLNELTALQSELTRRGVDAALFASAENARYTVGFSSIVDSPLSLVVVPAEGRPILLVPHSDEALARAAARAEVRPYDPGTEGMKATGAACRRELAAMGLSRGVLGLEFGSLTVGPFRTLQQSLPGFRLQDIDDAMATLRLVKNQTEQTCIRRAAELGRLAMDAAVASLKPGATEAEVKATIDRTAFLEGAARWPDAVIGTHSNVVTGPKTERLHALATGRAVREGEMAFALAAVSCDGYWADIARVVVISGGKPRREERRLLEATHRAQDAAIDNIGPGRTLGEARAAADAVLAERDPQAGRRYSMFRGLGLSMSERPNEQDEDMPLRPGMSLCVQVYLCAHGSTVGRSDTVLITRSGAEALTAPDLSDPAHRPVAFRSSRDGA